MGVRGLRSAEKSKIIQTRSVENCDSRGPQERLREEEATGKGLQRGDSEGKEDPDRLPVERVSMDIFLQMRLLRPQASQTLSRSHKEEEETCFCVGPCCSPLSDFRGYALYPPTSIYQPYTTAVSAP